MEQDNIQNQIKARFNELPKQIQDAITDSEWEQKIRNIARK
jgi:hypothetical protein